MSDYKPLSPRAVVERVAEAIPAAAREQVILVGSLAAGFHFFGRRRDVTVRTKDVDCLLAPRVRAIGVLAIASLTDDATIAGWPAAWWEDLRACFGPDARELALRAGSGLRALLASPADLDEARHTCEWGLLSSRPPTSEQLRARGLRLLQDAIEPLEKLARAVPEG